MAFPRHFAMHTSTEFGEDQPPEQAVPRQPTHLSFHQVCRCSFVELLLFPLVLGIRARHGVFTVESRTLRGLRIRR